MPMEAYRSTGNARCSTATQRPSFRWVLPRGRLELSARRARQTSKQHNNVNITHNTRNPSCSLSSGPRSLLTGPTIVISQPAQQRRPTWAPPTSAIHQSVWRQRRDSLWRAPLSPVTIRPPTPRQVGCAPSPRPIRAQVSVLTLLSAAAWQIAALSQFAASCDTCQICCSISMLEKQTQKLICDIWPRLSSCNRVCPK